MAAHSPFFSLSSPASLLRLPGPVWPVKLKAAIVRTPSRPSKSPRKAPQPVAVSRQFLAASLLVAWRKSEGLRSDHFIAHSYRIQLPIEWETPISASLSSAVSNNRAGDRKQYRLEKNCNWLRFAKNVFARKPTRNHYNNLFLIMRRSICKHRPHPGNCNWYSRRNGRHMAGVHLPLTRHTVFSE